MTKKIWLMKTEPSTYSIDDLVKDKTTWWESVRNYQARNFMMNDMGVGDVVLFYHSSCEEPGIYGLAEVSAPAAPDVTQFDKKSPYFEPKATHEKPTWMCVQIKIKEKLKSPLLLPALKSQTALKDMLLFQRGQRLSIQPVKVPHFELISKMITAGSQKAKK